ncbi:MAG: dihydroorotate dehydrogenase-like protein [Bacteroidales bacterium]|nr:dihydroorotate dehydrogenase-like protein [Bacteroidales bacterium]MBN2817885.1 dihydroorotate dehydrogenase-like protein [Bacteroidales bacterium]
MSNLSVSYLGLNLKTPIIVGSSGLTDSVSKVVKLAETGAGAVVLKSLFEEQIKYEAGSMIMDGQYPEAEDYLAGYVRSHSVDNYLKLIEDTKKEVDIPVVASVNCVSAGEWISFAKMAEEAGADALELNVFFLPVNVNHDSNHFENIYCDIITQVKKETKIPVAVKIGQNFSNLPGFVNKIYQRGAQGVVLFNRFYAPDINIEKIEFTPANVLSSADEIRNSLRWVGIISSIVEKIEVCASTGVHDGSAVIKQLLAGATAVQVCSALYKNGPEHIGNMLKDIEAWMDKNTFETVKDFRGRLNYKRIKDPSVFERSQFMKYYSDKK